MRIWNVPFCELDNARSVAQHSEVHAIYEIIWTLGHRWKGWEKPKYTRALIDVHRRSVRELEVRGYTGHRSPVIVPPEIQEYIKNVRQVKRKVSPELLQEERWLLWNRWNGSYRGRGEMPAEYLPLQERRSAQGGCLHDGEVQILSRKPRIELCLTCKRYQRLIVLEHDHILTDHSTHIPNNHLAHIPTDHTAGAALPEANVWVPRKSHIYV